MTKRSKPVKLTEHFSLEEFRCGCGCDGHLAPEIRARLLQLCERRLEPIRAAIGGVGLTIYTGYRCQAYNDRCGGAKRSQHLLGAAADLTAKRASVSQIGMAARAVMAELDDTGGVKEYHRKDRVSFCHVDDRAGRWDGKR